jgi:Dyp-type peroxidase family
MTLELEDIQGNVLRGYGHPFAAFVALRVVDAASGRRLIRDLLPGVTTAAPWFGEPPATTLNIAISFAGLCALGVDDEHLRSFPAEYREGMQARAEQQLLDVGPSHPALWEDGLCAGDVDLLVSVYGRTEQDLDERLALVRKRLCSSDDGVRLGRIQRTNALLVDGARREHFGYADGLGQPAIEGVEGRAYPGQGVATDAGLKVTRLGPLPVPHPARAGWRSVKAGEFVLGYHDEDDVVAPAPASPLGRNGTFMVVRKLEQDVVAFRRLVKELATRNYSGNRALAAAKIVGRWPDGTPLALSPNHADAAIAGDPNRLNDFRFDDDLPGHGCPLGAHIRRANPRASLPGKAQRTRRHRIVRRGMPYGPWLDPAEPGDSRSRGLLFVCFQASIVRQFEVVNRWCVEGSTIGIGQDRDYLTDAPDDGMTLQGDPPIFLRGHGPLVTTRGGEYLFVPGMSALAAIAVRQASCAVPLRRPVGVGAEEQS